MSQSFEAELSLTGLEGADSVQLYTNGIPNPATCREPERDNKLFFSMETVSVWSIFRMDIAWMSLRTGSRFFTEPSVSGIQALTAC